MSKLHPGVTVRFRLVSPPPHVCEQGVHLLQPPTPHVGLGVGLCVGSAVGLWVGLDVVVGPGVGFGVGHG